MNKGTVTIPAQQQNQHPGIEAEMTPQPEVIRHDYRGSGKPEGKVALITSGDSGIGRVGKLNILVNNAPGSLR